MRRLLPLLLALTACGPSDVTMLDRVAVKDRAAARERTAVEGPNWMSPNCIKRTAMFYHLSWENGPDRLNVYAQCEGETREWKLEGQEAVAVLKDYLRKTNAENASATCTDR